jgi:hypothetical protein
MSVDRLTPAETSVREKQDGDVSVRSTRHGLVERFLEGAGDLLIDKRGCLNELAARLRDTFVATPAPAKKIFVITSLPSALPLLIGLLRALWASVRE